MGSIVNGRKVARRKVWALSLVCNISQGITKAGVRKHDDNKNKGTLNKAAFIGCLPQIEFRGSQTLESRPSYQVGNTSCHLIEEHVGRGEGKGLVSWELSEEAAVPVHGHCPLCLACSVSRSAASTHLPVSSQAPLLLLGLVPQNLTAPS